MYDSLRAHAPEFHLYVFAFNELARETLQALALPHLTVVSLKEFEDKDLLRVKKERTRAEYCWTSTSSTILYVLNNFNEPNCTYVDADMVFYSDPGALIREAEEAGKSVMITSHRYTRRYDQSKLRGKYCVQFMYFRNNPEGREVLQWWRDRCIEWCYARVEDGKFGDQKYLDDWTIRFPSVHELVHEGGGIAPWNCQQYRLTGDIEDKILTNLETGKAWPLVFFHFHGVKLFEGLRMVCAPRSYSLKRDVREIYADYRLRLIRKGEELARVFPGQDFHGMGTQSRYFREKYLVGHYSWLKRNVLGRFFPPGI